MQFDRRGITVTSVNTPSSKSRFLQALRWAAVPFAFLAGYVGAILIAQLVGWFLLNENSSDDGARVLYFIPRDFLVHHGREFIKVIFGPWGAVTFAVYTAPRGKLATALVTAAICVLLAGGLLTVILLGLVSPEKFAWSDSPALLITQTLIIGVSAGVAAFQVYKTHENSLRTQAFAEAKAAFQYKGPSAVEEPNDHRQSANEETVFD